ncbi:MAG TPA: UvrD-helicase domain-containing protein [Acidimicrobiales bacterium]
MTPARRARPGTSQAGQREQAGQRGQAGQRAGRRTRRSKPVDHAVRDAVRDRLDDTLFVEAGAGSGKTSCLVSRFVALVESGVPADAIAAITFTEQAAAELADRVRHALQVRAAAGSSRSAAALDALDGAAICTLHSFAQRMLVAHPIEARIPPRVEVLDEIASEIAFERRWDAALDRILADPALERPIRLLRSCGSRVVEQLRDLALAFGDNWDLVAVRLGSAVVVPPIDIGEWCAEAGALVAMGDGCRAPDDALLPKLAELAAYVQQLQEAPDEEAVLRLLLADQPTLRWGNVGRPASFAAGVRDEIRAQASALREDRARIAGEVTDACVRALAEAVARFTVDRAAERRAEGRLEFHDLLVLARDVLRDPAHGRAVRASLAQRYQRLLLDEFQDTDPIQIDLAVLLASDDPAAPEKRWQDVEPAPGRLFFVGDPKQSIYRFRRADISVFLDARETFTAEPAQLTANFRTGRTILSWVNRAFEEVIVEDVGSQPSYVPLDAMRDDAPSGHPVTLLGAAIHDDRPKADELRDREATDVAAAVRRVLDDGWDVFDVATAAWRPAQPADVCILLPARTSLAALERALEAQDVAYRVETSSLVYASREVRDVMAVARAIDDPTDQLSLVTALRSAAFGCGDDDLFTWRRVHGGRWDHQSPVPDGAPADHPVARAMAWLAGMHARRAWLAASEVLDLVVRERRLRQVAFASRRPRDVLRRLRFVVDQARAWQSAGGGSLRDYLSWVELQSLESSRVVETVLPESDEQSVRIMTIHGAKGLEFPVTVLSGMTTEFRRRRTGVEVLFPPGASHWAIRLNGKATTAEFEAAKPRDEQMDADERRRLLYVAATRARDHLLVSVHRKERATDRPPSTAAELLWEHGDVEGLVSYTPERIGQLFFEFDVGVGDPGDEDDSGEPGGDGGDGFDGGDRFAGRAPGERGAGHERTVVPRAPSTEEEWRARHAAALASGMRPVSIAATRAGEPVSTDPGLAKGPRDLDLPPWQKGRYGTAVGRAVHGVLQVVDLATGDGLAGAVLSQAAAEGVLGHEATIEALCRSALASEVVRRAAGARHWREVYVGAPLAAGPALAGNAVLEGYIDLVYRDRGALVVVDYKTGAVPRGPAAAESMADRYRAQLSAYADALEHVTGETVAEVVLLFLGEHEHRAVAVDRAPPLALAAR